MQSSTSFPDWHGTTILAVRKNGQTVIAGDSRTSAPPLTPEVWTVSFASRVSASRRPTVIAPPAQTSTWPMGR